MNLKRWAELNGVGYSTARRWFECGMLPVPAQRVGRLIVVADGNSPEMTLTERGRVVVYARVSSSDQRSDLDRQVARVVAWALPRGYVISDVVTEVGSALNGRRKKFLGLLRDPSVAVIIVEHRDRFARFGSEYVAAAMTASGRELVVVDPAEIDDDLVRDMTELLTSLCARLYGARGAAARARRLADAAAGAGDANLPRPRS